MGSMEELEGRVTSLETEMRSVRQDAAAARVLAGGADRDVAALTLRMDAQTKLMQALRETQVEDHAAIAELKGDMAGVKGGVAELKGDMAEVKGDMAEVKGDMAEVKGDMAEVKGDMAELKGDMAELKGDMAEVKSDVAELKVGFVNLARGQEMIVELLRRRNGHE